MPARGGSCWCLFLVLLGRAAYVGCRRVGRPPCGGRGAAAFCGPLGPQNQPRGGGQRPPPLGCGRGAPPPPPTGRWNFYGPTHPSAIPFRPEFRLTMAAACIDLSGPGFGSDPAALLVVPMAPLFMHVFLHKVSLFPWAENTIILLEPGCQWERIVISHKNMY